MRGTTSGPRVTPVRLARTYRMHESLESERGSSGLCDGTRGSARRETWRLPGGGNLWKRKLKGATGMKQGRKVRGGLTRQEVEKA